MERDIESFVEHNTQMIIVNEKKTKTTNSIGRWPKNNYSNVIGTQVSSEQLLYTE